MMNLFALKQNSGIASMAVLSAWFVVFIAVIALVGFVFNLELLAGALKSGYISMAPATAISFVVFGLVIASGACHIQVLFRRQLFTIAIGLVSLYCFFIFIVQIIGIELVQSNRYFKLISCLLVDPINRMAPYAGLLFFLSGVTLIAKIFFPRKWIVLQFVSGMGFLVGFAGFVISLGYLFGTPFQYSGSLIPIAFNTGVSFMVLGISMVSLGGSNSFISRLFSGSVSSSIVLRVFLPLIIGGIILQSLAFVILTEYFALNAALVLALLTVISVILTTVVIILVSKYVFKKADLAEVERKKTEEIIRRERILLRTLIDNIPDTIYVKDVDARKVLANNADVLATGFQNETEILGKLDTEIFNEIDGEHGYAQDMQVIKSGKSLIDDEKEYIDNEGVVKWLRTSKIPLRDSNGIIVGLVGIGHDITDKKNQEEQFLLMTHALKSLNDCVSITDINDQIIYVNDGFLKTYGYERSELIGQNIKIVRKKDSEEELTDIILPATIHSGWHGEIINCRKDGTEFPIEISSSPVRNEAGEIIALIGIATDITERKRMEAALESSKEQYRVLVENQGEGLGQVDVNEVFKFANPAAEQIFGVESGGLLGKNLSEFVSPESMEFIRSETKKRARNERSSYEIDILTKDGQKRYLLITATPQIDQNGNHIGAFGIFRDITLQKQADIELVKQKTFLETIIESLNHPFYVINVEDFTVKLSNTAAKKFFKQGKKTCYGMTHNAEMPCSMLGEKCPLDICVKTKKSISVEHVHTDKHGHTMIADVHVYPIFDENGMVTQVIEYSLDITERKNIEFQLAKQTDELRELNSTKDKFFSIIAHDLRSPFSAILGLSGLLSSNFSEFDSKTIEDSVNEIDKASKKAFSLLENLLEWARSQTGKMEFLPEKFDMVSLINEAVGVAQTFAKKKGVMLSAIMPDKLDVFADKNMIHTILRNLISNALKFTPQHGKVVVTMYSTKHHIVFSVADSGVGISKANIEKLFKIDKSFTNPGTNNEKGTGLGLVLCKEFVQMHKGEIWVESELGKGSTFLVKIPLDDLNS
ncbi:MAG: PAS domain S-box protein [Bacteroidales bacterium]|nr:PAS domain S-box protein [Bacteroidales bacterium]